MKGKIFPVLGALLALTLVVYWPVRGHEFLVFDDDTYVTANPAVLAGLTRQGMAWAVTSLGYASNWHPLTWLSHQLDVQLFGLNPGLHHLTSLGFHLASTALLMLVLRGLTGLLWPSVLVAALFAVHPLHVESVAWIAERKDVLSAFFWVLTLASYLRYLRRPGAARYLLMVAIFALGLAAKPMLVSLPGVLLLLDYWPLGRFAPGGVRPGGRPTAAIAVSLVVEKLPLLVLAAASAVVTLIAQSREEAMQALASSPLPGRFAGALAALGAYLFKAVWPVRLAAYYPSSAQGPPLWQAVAGFLVLAGGTVAALRLARRAPYLPTGWFWYLITLAPVIGIVKVGTQAMADRYTYLPLLGPFLILGWGLRELSGRNRALVGGAALLLPLLLAPRARSQVELWRDDLTLFAHARNVAGESTLVEFNLAYGLARRGRLEEGLPHLERALQLDPRNGPAHNLLGWALLRSRRHEEAIVHLLQAVRYAPREATAYNNLASALVGLGRLEEAGPYAAEALRRNPAFFEARYNLGMIATRLGRWDEARTHFREALRLKPGHPETAQRLREIEARRSRS